MPLLYNCASSFVYPSLEEGFGVPPLEAMACEVPVVASNTCSIPEIVGDAAMLVDCVDPIKLAEAIHRSINDGTLRFDLIEKGKKRAEYFANIEMAEKIIGVYKDANELNQKRTKRDLPIDLIQEVRNLSKQVGADYLFDSWNNRKE